MEKQNKNCEMLCITCKSLKQPEEFLSHLSRICSKCKHASLLITRRRLRKEKRFILSVQRAKYREFDWSVLEEDYDKLIELPCHYCLKPLEPAGVGLDRKDNKQGYTIDNVVPCCQRCNWVKGHVYSYEQMLEIAKGIRFIDLRRDSNLDFCI